MKTTPVLFAISATLLISACSDSSDLGGVSVGANNVTASPRLKNFGDEEGFYSALRAALVNQSSQYNYYVNSVDGDLAEGGIQQPLSSPDEASAESSADSAASSTSSVSSGSGNEVTSTNVQELGVDEQDRVKVSADGSRLFVLHTEYDYYGPGIDFPLVDGAPAPTASGSASLSSSANQPISARSSIAVPQQASTTLRILQLDPETPNAEGLNELALDLEGRVADGFFLYETTNETSLAVTASGGGYWGYWDDSSAFQDVQSIIAKVDVQDASQADIAASFTLDGQIISSRRIGDSLFVASRYSPTVPGVQPWVQPAEQWQDAVEATDLQQLMPQFSRRNSDESISLVDASSCFVAPGVADNPSTPDIITLAVIDIPTMQLRDSECFLGSTETLYANTESVFLATTQYSYDNIPEIGGLEIDSVGDVWTDPRTSTDIHQFDITDGQLDYAGSGSVRGHLGWNPLQKPFRMSESAGYLRVATMNDQQGPDHSPILFDILQADGQGNLVSVGNLPNDTQPEHIGKPGEQLYASRFVGNKAYLVTFRQTDPLYVLDLADPTNPELKGELEIEGYSDYLHPIDENLLLGIGKNAIAAQDDWGDGRGAWIQGIKLSLFDVSDPSQPSEVTSVLVGERGTESDALRNHKAITVQPATQDHPTRVSFGIDVYGQAEPASLPSQDNAWRYNEWSYTGLHGFDITTGANANIIPRGALVVERTNNDKWWPNYGDDRAVMVNDAVFYIRGKDVYPALWDNLSNAPQPR